MSSNLYNGISDDLDMYDYDLDDPDNIVRSPLGISPPPPQHTFPPP